MSKTTKTLLALLAAFTSFAALAQGTAPNLDIAQLLSATKTGDWSTQIWSSLLGEFATNPFGVAGGPYSMLSMLFVIFNSAIFAVSVAWLGYGVLSGVVGTAQDGQALGQRINTAWYPIRVTVGITGVMPVLGGFTLSQGFLMYLAAIGIGTANFMWNAAVQAPGVTRLVNHEAFASKPVLPRSDVVQAVTAGISSHICLLGYQKLQQEIVDAGGAIASRDALSRRTEVLPSGLKIKYGTAAKQELCGSISFTMERVREEGSITAYRNSSVNYAGIRASVAQQLADRLVTLDSLMEGAARSYDTAINGWHSSKSDEPINLDPRTLTAIVDAYLGDAQALVQPLTAGLTPQVHADAQRRMLANGWMSAGSYFATFAEANAALADATSGANIVVGAPKDGLADSVAEQVSQFLAWVDRQKPTISPEMGDFCAGSSLLTAALGTSTGNCSVGQAIVSRVIGGTARGSGGGSEASGSILFGTGQDQVGLVNPVIAAKNVGDYVMTAATAMIAYDYTAEKIFAGGGWLAATAAKWTGTAGSVVGIPGAPALAAAGDAAQKTSGMATEFLKHITSFGWMFLFLGALMAIYIPFLPLIAWIGGMISYTASFLEGFVAMPLHSMAHMHTDGEGMGQSTSHGYLFYLNTFARPPLMVISFFLASGLVIALGTVATYMFIPAMANVQGNSVTGLASIVGLIVIYFVILSVIINGCFDLIQVIPDQVIGFVGAGSVSTRLGQDAESKINALYLSGVRGGSSAAAGFKQGIDASKKEKMKAAASAGSRNAADGGRK
jgi:conjugal transfer/type IV secretion protein DotA/TraY